MKLSLEQYEGSQKFGKEGAWLCRPTWIPTLAQLLLLYSARNVSLDPEC